MAKKNEVMQTDPHGVELFFRRSRGYVDDSPYLGHELSRGVYDKRELDIVYPIDDATGFPATDLGRLTNPFLSDVEKQKVMSRLSSSFVERGSYLPSDLTDEEVFAIVPPRYFTFDQVDVQKWRDYLATDVLPYMDVQIPEQPKAEPEAEPKAEPKEE